MSKTDFLQRFIRVTSDIFFYSEVKSHRTILQRIIPALSFFLAIQNACT